MLCRTMFDVAGGGEQLCRIGLEPGCFGQDRVVHVEHRVPEYVLHRRQLMHPLAVVLLVVGRVVGAGPTTRHERGLNLRQSGLGYQEVNV